MSWNPLHCGAAALPVNILLMAKLIALTLLLTNHVLLLPDPFLPFIPQLDQVPHLKIALQGVFVAAAVALLLNRWVRVACLLLGGSILAAVLASKAYYGNNKTFCGLMLVLAGLQERNGDPWLLRWQMVIVYFGAGLNKLLDPDWQSGLFFDYWASAKLKNPLYIAAARALPPLVAGKVVCWVTTATELALAGLFPIRRAVPYAIYLSVLFQSALLLVTGSTFTMFFYAMQAAMFVFVEWPKQRWIVIYNGESAVVNGVRWLHTRLDFEDTFDWKPYRSGIGARYGLRQEARTYLVREDKSRISGGGAWRLILLFTPATWFALAIALALPPWDAALYRRLIVGGCLLLDAAARISTKFSDTQ